MGQAACRQVDPEIFHDGHLHHRAVHVCLAHCPVKGQCRQWALAARPLAWDGQVIGGEAWVRHGSSVRVGKVQPEPSATGCRLCRSAP
jgi:hypothetical protein